jgi:hypothetical protein
LATFIGGLSNRFFIPKETTIIRDYLLDGDTIINYIDWSNELEDNSIEIGKNVFNNSALKELVVPKSVKTVDQYLCYNSQNLENVVWNSDADIPYYAF